MTNEKSDAQIAFEAYREYRGGIAFDGSEIPQWHEVNEEVRAGWEHALSAVANKNKITFTTTGTCDVISIGIDCCDNGCCCN